MSDNTPKPQIRIHPITGELLTRGVRTVTLTYKCLSEDVELPGWYRVGDSDGIHFGVDLRASDEAINRMRAIHEGRAREEE